MRPAAALPRQDAWESRSAQVGQDTTAITEVHWNGVAPPHVPLSGPLGQPGARLLSWHSRPRVKPAAATSCGRRPGMYSIGNAWTYAWPMSAGDIIVLGVTQHMPDNAGSGGPIRTHVWGRGTCSSYCRPGALWCQAVARAGREQTILSARTLL